MAHRHKAVRDVDFGYGYCVDPDHCNPSAHGSIRREEVCRCGAERHTNLNGKHRESTGWVPAERIALPLVRRSG